MTYTANVCTNTMYYLISFNYNNEIYLISTGYIIDYNHKIINELNKLGILLINNYPNCNWYRVKQVWNTGINTGNIYIQGANYNISNVQNIIDLLETNYPITETLIAISLGLILPCILILIYIFYIKVKMRRQIKNLLSNAETYVETYAETYKRQEISEKIKNYILNPPSYELDYSVKTFKENLYNEYNTQFHKYINEKIEEYTELSKNQGYNSCIKCKSEKIKLYKNKYNLYECEKCQL